MKVAFHAGVSSEHQDTDLPISAPLKALRKCDSCNEHVMVEECVDEAESGRPVNRPGFKQMIVPAARY
jgi:DNA invertase Pin-like site-specific DNA recombinase